MNSKLISLALTSLLAVAAHGSFEMIIAVDGANGKLVRMDPENGVLLGTLNTPGLASPRGIAINQAANEVLTCTGTGIARVNYNTGSLVGSISLNDAAIGALGSVGASKLRRSANGDLAITGYWYGSVNTYQTRIYSSTGTFLRVLPGFASETPIDCVQLADGRYMALTATTSSPYIQYINVYNSTGTYFGANTLVTGSTTQRVYTALSTNGTQMMLLHNNAFPNSKYGTSPSGTTFNWQSPLFGTYVSGSYTDTVFGHNGVTYSSAYSFNSGYSSNLVSYNSITGSYNVVFNNISGMAITDMAIVVAPEPGGLAILSLGGLLLLRRNRASRVKARTI